MRQTNKDDNGKDEDETNERTQEDISEEAEYHAGKKADQPVAPVGSSGLLVKQGSTASKQSQPLQPLQVPGSFGGDGLFLPRGLGQEISRHTAVVNPHITDTIAEIFGVRRSNRIKGLDADKTEK